MSIHMSMRTSIRMSTHMSMRISIRHVYTHVNAHIYTACLHVFTHKCRCAVILAAVWSRYVASAPCRAPIRIRPTASTNQIFEGFWAQSPLLRNPPDIHRAAAPRHQLTFVVQSLALRPQLFIVGYYLLSAMNHSIIRKVVHTKEPCCIKFGRFALTLDV